MLPNPQCEIPPAVKPELKPFDTPADRIQLDDASRPVQPLDDGNENAGLAPTLARIPSIVGDALVGQQVGEYQVLGRIGAGGMGLVYEAIQPVIGKRVAIKVLRPEYASDSEQMHRLLSEARAVNAVGHRGIIDIFAFGQLPDARHYFVMEFLHGESLEDFMLRSGPLTEAQAFAFLDEILSALGAAHAAGVVHRDLKPSNVFLVKQANGTPYVKVLDFGLAKVAQTPHGLTPQTRADMVVGTPEFMAPEQARGQAVGPATDLYSLGVLAYQMVTGKLPFTGGSAVEIVIKHVEEKPKPPSDAAPKLHRTFEAVILRLLSKRAEDRPASADHARDLFRAALHQPAAATPPPQPMSISAAALAAAAPPKVPSAAPSSRLLFAAIAPVAALALGVGAFFGFRSELPAEPAVAVVQAPPVIAKVDEAKVDEVNVDAPPSPVPAKLEARAEPEVVPAPAKVVPVSAVPEKAVRQKGPTRASLFSRVQRLDAALSDSSARAGLEADPTAKLLLNSARGKIRRAKDAGALRDAAKYLDQWESQYLRR